MVNSINVNGYGSLQNAMGNQTRSLWPIVGIGVTELMYSDRHPYTVMSVLSAKRIIVRADLAIRTDKNGCSENQSYDYVDDRNAVAIELRLNKFGRWKRLGDSQGSTFLIGRREEYYDFTR